MKRILSVGAALALAACSESTGPDRVACDPALLQLQTLAVRDTVVAPSGLRTIDIRVGTGATAVVGSAVRAHYSGYLVNGTRFDTSCTDEEPLYYTLPGSVVQGFWQGTVGMRVGGVRRLIIPPNLAYGANPPSSTIPPNSTLIFDLQLDAVLND